MFCHGWPLYSEKQAYAYHHAPTGWHVLHSSLSQPIDRIGLPHSLVERVELLLLTCRRPRAGAKVRARMKLPGLVSKCQKSQANSRLPTPTNAISPAPDVLEVDSGVFVVEGCSSNVNRRLA
jgi:hypothetical protein